MSADTSLSNKEIASYLRQAGFPEDVVPRMIAIARAESGGRPDAHNPRYPDDSYGLWQINMLDEPGYRLGEERRQRYGLTSNEQLKDPLTNAKAALDVYKRQGLNAWSVHTSGAADKFMPDARKAAGQSEPMEETSTSSEKESKPPGRSAVSELLGTFMGKVLKGDRSSIPAPELPSYEADAEEVIRGEEASLGTILEQMRSDQKAEADRTSREAAMQSALRTEVERSKAAAASLAAEAMKAFGGAPDSII